MRWVRRGLYALLTVVALTVLAGIGGYVWLRGSLPQTSGTVVVTGIDGPAEIVRDDDGIVTIRAASEADAWFALGYVHAQDRLFQMDFMRRLGAGRLSEVVGDAAVATDTLMRILGPHRLAEASIAALPPGLRTALDAYSAGINAFLDGRPGALPPEFALLRYRPEPWQAADSLVWGKLLAFQLSGNWWDELLRYRLSQKLTAEQLEKLWPAMPGNARQAAALTSRQHLADIGSAPGSMPTLPLLARSLGASNSFVVGGMRSGSGKPLLANDPHLSLQTPSQWYLARIETPTLRLAGATVPG
ncbi:MAG: penicillin acylase family protein, partial [Dongiaceae bacterium]